MADTFVLGISKNWRIAEDRLQWILQRCGNKKRYADCRDNPKNWNGRAFCCTRKALIRCIGEYVKLEPDEDSGLVEAAVARVQTWPEMHRPRPGPLAGVELDGDQDLDQRETADRDVA